MEREKRNDMSFSRKRSFTFGAYGGSHFLVYSVDRFTCGDETRPESADDNILDILDSPARDRKPFLPASSNQRDTELFEIIEKLQGSRIDEQRCEFPPPLKSQLLTIGGDLPLILPPSQGGYWVDPPLDRLVDVSPTSSHCGLDDSESYDIMERDGEAKIYQEFFSSRYHHSFTAVDPSLGPLVLSVCLEEEESKLRVILRMKECSLHGVFSASLFPNIPSAVELAKMLCDRVTVSKFEVVSYLKAPELITAFDEHRVSPNFKFGVLYQKDGQFTEEDILSNNEESEEFKEFLSVLGETIQLQGFSGFRGGLDVCHGQTGSEAVFTSFHGREIMFHVATKLPFTEGDPQQLQRKRHIGNDIVALVYQDGQTPFLSDIIKSHFLHCFLVVRRIQDPEETGETAYQVSVTAREDVPNFGPVLPDPPIFRDRSLLREFLLTKLINAEISCYKAERFSRLELRTRSSLLESLQAELSTRSQCMMGDPSLSGSEGTRGATEGSGGFIENFKRAIRVRSHSFETLGVPRKTGGSASQKPKTEKDGESDKSPGPLPADSLGSAEIKDQASSQEETL
ncbi:rap1 GTPase-activating protein 2 isoform X1 [Epinephelus fuscoguttatus]|uniref:rap1 GTPase-activating protein 2 isoform X1 n=1 Tax=Epinephelus fuscoguttatus TaxID=293821 RepID=UPI0020D1467C|nr:rap1 GTPase-activating protein 2 isoform X1 [Epinephelus fuscoguttatus]XP_049439590.1 rap1 GTPase-activating protein 2 isoform X1 [Epinephelus fuscoguttatus]XP_049439591.1 rap1 GTPase-activating protein 2 isoform X1 [Epinephelus fuscoguttatus]